MVLAVSRSRLQRSIAGRRGCRQRSIVGWRESIWHDLTAAGRAKALYAATSRIRSNFDKFAAKGYVNEARKTGKKRKKK